MPCPEFFAALLALGLGACGKDAPPPPKAGAPAAAPAAKAAPAPETAKKAEDPRAAADAALAAKVKEALAATAGLNVHRIDVVASDGAVTLFGTADNPAQRDQAARVAAGVQGVRSVANKLAIVAGS